MDNGTVEEIRIVIEGDTGTATQSIDQVLAKLQELKASYADLTRTIKAVGNLKLPSGGQGSGGGSGASASTKFASIKNAFSKALIPARQLAKVTATIGKTIATWPFKKVSGAISNVASKFKNIGTMFKKRALYRLLNSVISSITNGFKEGLGNVYEYSKALNGPLANSLDSIATSFLYLKNSLGAAVAPLVNALAPAIDFVIDKAVDLLNVLNQVFAVLTGASTWTKALKYPTTFADETKNANKAAKELKKTILGIDEINPLKDNSNNNGGGSGSSLDASQMFEEVAVSNGITTFFDNLKSLFENGDYEGIGQTIADGINTAISSIHEKVKWENVGEEISGFTDQFAGIFNGLVDNVNFAEIGQTIADGVNTAINTANQLINKPDWSGLFAGLGTSVSEMVKGINFEDLGQTVSDAFRTALESVQSFTDAMDLKGMGESIAQFFNGYDLKETIGEIGPTLSSLLTGAFDFGSGFFEGVDWLDLGMQLYEGLKETISGINWGELVSSALEFVGSALGGLTATLAGIGYDLICDIVEGFGNIAEFFSQPGEDIIAGLGEGITTALSDIGTWIVNNIWNPFKEGFCKAFGIASPSKKMAEEAKYIIEGLKQGLTDAWNNITGWFAEKFEAIKTTIAGFWTKIKDETRRKWQKIKETLSDAIKNIKREIVEKITNIKDSALKIWDTFKTKTQEKFKFIKDWLVWLWGEVKRLIAVPINAIIGGFETMVRGVAKGLNKVIDALNLIHVKIPDWSPVFPGKEFGFNINRLNENITFDRLAEGGIVSAGTMFIAGEAGPEVVASVGGGQSGVMNVDQMADAITEGVVEANMIQNALIREGLALLRGILDKDSNSYMSSDAIINTLARANRRAGRTIVPVNI